MASTSDTTSEPQLRLMPTLGEALAEGLKINKEMGRYLSQAEWSPAVAFMLISGIKPRSGQTKLPLSGTGLDGRILSASNARITQARRLLRSWTEHWEDEIAPTQITPFEFFVWCDENGVDSEWLRQFEALAGFRVSNRFDRTYAAMAMIMDAQLAGGLLDPLDFTEKDRARKYGHVWTIKKIEELYEFKKKHGLKKTAENYGISKARVGQILKKQSHKSSSHSLQTVWTSTK